MSYENPEDIPIGMRKVHRLLGTLAKEASWASADPEAALGRSRGCGAGARSFSNVEGIASGVQQAKRVRGKGETEEAGNNAAGAVCGANDDVSGRCFGVRDRDGRAARQDAHSMERNDGGGSGPAQPDDDGADVIQITPQMKILVAIEAVDGRNLLRNFTSFTSFCERYDR